MTASTIAATAASQVLVRAWRDGTSVPPSLVQPADRGEAYAIQEATIAGIGTVGGWKVGARAATLEPTCAPLPAAGLLADGAVLRGPQWRLRGIEVEVGFELGADLPARGQPYTLADVEGAIESVLPVIEVVESRFTDWFGAGADSQLADLLSHGALVLGKRQPFDAAWLDLSGVRAELRFDHQVVAHTLGGHPCRQVAPLLVWLANHCAARGIGLGAGQVITTGSCTGMLFASAGTAVRAEIGDLSPLEVFF